MRKIILPLIVIASAFCFSCNDASKKTDPLQAKADSLEKEVIAGHDIAMPKSMKIPELQKKVQSLIDSINKLPARTRESASSYKTELENLHKDLDDAYAAMDKWMNEFVYDSASNDVEMRIKYLSDEKTKVEKVKEAVLSSLQKADSVLKKKP